MPLKEILQKFQMELLHHSRQKPRTPTMFDKNTKQNERGKYLSQQ